VAWTKCGRLSGRFAGPYPETPHACKQLAWQLPQPHPPPGLLRATEGADPVATCRENMSRELKHELQVLEQSMTAAAPTAAGNSGGGSSRAGAGGSSGSAAAAPAQAGSAR
jgi:hypothetical protein